MARTRQFTLVVLGVLAVAAVALSPRRDERAAMLIGEGHLKEAMSLLETRRVAAPKDPEVLAMLGRTYLALGEIPQAIDAFDAYLAARPNDWEAREREAELLLQQGLVDRYLEALAHAAASAPTRERVTRLVELYRLHGRVREETDTLKTFAARDLLSLGQLERLGALLAEQGDWTGSRRWLEQANRQAPASASAGRLLLTEVLIRTRGFDEIDKFGPTWMAGWRNAFLSGQLLLSVAEAGGDDAASPLAQAFVDATPNDALPVLGLLADKGRRRLARRMLIRWAHDASDFTGPDMRAFAQRAAQLGGAEVGLEKFLQFSRMPSDPDKGARPAEELVHAFGDAALSAVRPQLSNAMLRARPLFAADLSLREGDPDRARLYLARLDPRTIAREDLPQLRALWLRLAASTATTAREDGDGAPSDAAAPYSGVLDGAPH